MSLICLFIFTYGSIAELASLLLAIVRAVLIIWAVMVALFVLASFRGYIVILNRAPDFVVST